MNIEEAMDPEKYLSSFQELSQEILQYLFSRLITLEINQL